MKPTTGTRKELIKVRESLIQNPQAGLKSTIIHCHDPVANGTYAEILYVLQSLIRPDIYPDLYNAWHHIEDFDASHSHSEVLELLDEASNKQ